MFEVKLNYFSTQFQAITNKTSTAKNTSFVKHFIQLLTKVQNHT